MPEHDDPISQLENFGNGGIMTTPLDPDAVRRLGDKRRVRRTTGLAAAAAFVVLAAVVPVTVIATRDAQGGGRVDPLVTPSPSAITASPPVPKVITYAGNGVEVSDPDQVDRLTGTSPEFKAFVADAVRKAQDDGVTCPDAVHAITVKKYSSDGYALGAVNDCGGYAALWVDLDDVWQEGMGTQDAWNCDTLSYLKIPKSFAGECFDEAGDFGPKAVGELELGMTAARVEAAGGTLGDPGEGCRTLVFPYRSAIPNQTDGYFSPSIGLAAMFARPGTTTPERIGLGSSLAKVRAAYPKATKSGNGYWVAPLGDDTEYQFGIDEDGNVSELVLTRTDQDCFG